MAEKGQCPIPGLSKVILCTNGTPQCEGAERGAIRLALSCSIPLVALGVVETNPEYEALAPGLVEKAGAVAREHLEAVCRRAEEAGARCAVLVRHGDEPHRSIVEEASGSGADLIVMGRRGLTGLKRAVLGSVTAKVIGHSPCDVLVAPAEAELGFRHILAATDGSRWSEAAAARAISIAANMGSALSVVSVAPSEAMERLDMVHSEMRSGLIAERESAIAEENARKVKDLAEKEGVRARAFVIAGRPFEAILEAAADVRADLVVMGSHGRTGLEKLLMGSVTQKVVTLSPRAVLVVRAR
ncbi:MAG: universal stress protein [Thermodesulfovibrionales bacterium]